MHLLERLLHFQHSQQSRCRRIQAVCNENALHSAEFLILSAAGAMIGTEISAGIQNEKLHRQWNEEKGRSKLTS